MSDDVPLGALLALLTILLVLSAFFSGTETALMRLNRHRLRHLARTGHQGAKLAEQLLSRPDRLIGLILFGNNLVNFMAASIVAVVAVRLGGPAAVAAGSFLLTFVVLIFAEVTPKTLAALHPERLALPSAFVYYPLLRLSLPLVWVINLMANSMLRLAGVNPENDDSQPVSMEELRTLVHESNALLPRRRYRMLMAILELEEMTVDDIMIPHNEVLGIDLNDDWDDIIETIRQSAFTRMPVYRDSLDKVSGVLHMKRLVQQGALENLDRATLERLLDDPYFVPEGTPLQTQLLQFQRTRRRTALIVDEYGDIQGMITLEDLLEEIVGEFTSEPAPDSEEVRRDDKSPGYIVSGNINIRALNRRMNWHLPTDGPKTLNGLILERLETIPPRGTGLMLADYPVEIMQTVDNAVKSVRILPPEERAA